MKIGDIIFYSSLGTIIVIAIIIGSAFIGE